MFFSEWTGDADLLVADRYAESTTLTMPSRDTVVSATYMVATSCAVTLSVIPENSGTVEMSTAQVYVGQTAHLTAAAASGYVFVRWEASASAAVAAAYAAATIATFSGDATVTALFAVKSPAQKAFVKMDNSKATLDVVGITASQFPAAAPFEFDPKSDSVSVLVDGIEYKLKASAGVFTQSGGKKVYKFKPVAKAVPCVKLVLDLEVGQWTMAISKADKMSKTVDNSDGVGIFLVVTKKSDAVGTFRAYGDAFNMTECTSWKYAAAVGAPKAGASMKIVSLQGKYYSDKSKGSKDQFKAAGTFPATGVEFEADIDTITMSIDDTWDQVVIDIDAELFTAKKIVKWKGENDFDNSGVELMVDLADGLWSLKMGKGDLDGVSGANGLGFALSLGSYEDTASCTPLQKSLLTYKTK